MSILRKLEKRLEKLFEGAFAKVLSDTLEPLEIAHHLERVIEENAVEGLKRTYVPNVYEIRVNRKDLNLLRPFLDDLAHELATFVREKAGELGAALPGPVEISFTENDRVKPGDLQILPRVQKRELEAALEEERALEKTQAIEPAEAARLGLTVVLATLENLETGQIHRISRFPVRVGRLESNDIRLTDPSVSRVHAEIVEESNAFVVRDLESTNGTKVNGRRVKEKRLAHGDVISFGTTRLRWQVTKP